MSACLSSPIRAVVEQAGSWPRMRGCCRPTCSRRWPRCLIRGREDNVRNPVAPWLYGISTLHCLTVSLAHDGAGLGTVWGEQLAKTMLTDVGFHGIEVHDVPDDPMNSVYVARKPG